MEATHGDTKDPISQKAIRLYYQEAPTAIVSQAEERYLNLLEAVSQGDESRVKELLSMNASLLARDSRGTTAGGLAAAKGHLSILKMIVEAGVDVNISTTDPWLYQALRNDHFTTAEFLIKSGATLLAKASKGAYAGDIEIAQLNILEKMVEAGVDFNINKTDPWLRQVLRNGHLNTAEFLIKSGAKLLATDSRGNAKHLGLEVAQLKVLKKMVKAGADVNINKTDPWLHQALRNGLITTAKFLIESGADVDAKSSENQTAFEEAVLRGSVDAISLLHRSGADIHPGSGSQSRLDEAILHGNESELLLLCESGVRVGEDPLPATSPRNEVLYQRLDSSTAPHGLAKAKLMLDYGAEICSKSSVESTSSLLKLSGETPAVEILWEYGTNIHEISLSRKEPAKTLLSVINYDNSCFVQLLLEERTTPKGRHLWEKILLHGTDRATGQETFVIRLLREWGPISTT
jgi:ankyrin repeat protein